MPMSPTLKAYIYKIGVGVFVVVVAWATLWGIEWLGELMAPQPIAQDEIPEFLRLKSEPRDVLYAEAYETEQGEEVKYAYMAEVVPPVDGEDISRRTPVSKSAVLAVEETEEEIIETVRTTFFSSPQFYEDGGEWRQIEYATTTPEVFAASGAIKYVERREWWERLLPGQPLFAQTSTFRPDPNPETSSVDGSISASNTDSSQSCFFFNGDVVSDAGTTLVVNIVSVANDNFPPGPGLEDDVTCTVNRTFLTFNTASLPDNATITAADVDLHIISVSSPQGLSVGLTTANPASNTSLVTGDFDEIGTSVISNSIAITSLSTGNYNTFSITSGNFSVINLTGTTELAWSTTADITGFIFVPDTSSNQVTARAAETSGTSQDPVLEVTYTAGANFSFGQWFPF